MSSSIDTEVCWKSGPPCSHVYLPLAARMNGVNFYQKKLRFASTHVQETQDRRNVLWERPLPDHS